MTYPNCVINDDVVVQVGCPSAECSGTGARIEKGCVVALGDPHNGYGRLSIGAMTWIGQYNNFRLASGAEIVVGDDCLISQFCSIVGANHRTDRLRTCSRDAMRHRAGWRGHRCRRVAWSWMYNTARRARSVAVPWLRPIALPLDQFLITKYGLARRRKRSANDREAWAPAAGGTECIPAGRPRDLAGLSCAGLAKVGMGSSCCSNERRTPRRRRISQTPPNWAGSAAPLP